MGVTSKTGIMTIKITYESDLTLEVVILLILGVFMTIFGILLFFIHTGSLPYNPDSMYGLLLVIASIQIITMGKTPFGDMNRSWAVIILGMIMSVLGMLACFIPGFVTDIVRTLVGAMLFFGGAALLFQLFVSEEKAKKWIHVPGVLQHLIIACGTIYILTIIAGLITLIPGIISSPETGWFLIIYGISFFYLAGCIQSVSRTYPETRSDGFGGIT